MRDLIPSGRFAQLTRLTRKALRVYAEQGLLRPVYTDFQSGYHYYSHSQLDEARRICHLRELGMSVETIHMTLRVWNTPDGQARLEQHRQELEQQEAALRLAIDELDRLLHMQPPRYAINTKQVLPQRCLTKRQSVIPSHTCAFIDSTEPLLLQTLTASVAKPAGPLIVRYYESSDDETWDIEVCQPFHGDLYLHLPAKVQDIFLPGGISAWTIHAGDTEGDFGLQAAHEAVWVWIRDHGHDTLGPPYEVYLFDETNTSNPADYRTEVGWLIQ